jgi:hypothetical protein
MGKGAGSAYKWNIFAYFSENIAHGGPYIHLHLEIDSEGRLRTKLYVKRDDFNIPIVSLWFLSGFL